MKKRSMLAIASLAAGVVTALVTPPPQANATESPLAGTTGLLQQDQTADVLHDTVEGAQGALQNQQAGGLL
ncbi:hypothetical protein ACWEPZ_10605 [Streptomyces sp. NPDC004288]|uniref:hypothetical protein n=1 Tax=unclassified Streptomyces TaxID=2593676 RepID=UPI0033F892EC